MKTSEKLIADAQLIAQAQHRHSSAVSLHQLLTVLLQTCQHRPAIVVSPTRCSTAHLLATG